MLSIKDNGKVKLIVKIKVDRFVILSNKRNKKFCLTMIYSKLPVKKMPVCLGYTRQFSLYKIDE